MVVCTAGFLVSVVPLVRDGHLDAMFQLVEPGRIPRAAFQHRVALIGRILAEFAGGADCESQRKQKATSSVGPWWRPQKSGTHPQVQKAIAYIEQHVSDPHTNVATVARALGINSTYLSHIFSEEMGTRMSRFIANRRIQLAKKLLSTTDWQIKRVAFESGHSNADWFSQVFHAYAGMTPCDYRRTSRAAK
jgi:transcriptional regulator GlxA family with amidase domain